MTELDLIYHDTDSEICWNNLELSADPHSSIIGLIIHHLFNNSLKEFYDYVKNVKLLSNRVAAFKAGMEAAGKELSDAETTACKAATDLDNHSEIKEKFLTEWSHDMDDEEI